MLHGEALKPLLRSFSLPQLAEITRVHERVDAGLDDLFDDAIDEGVVFHSAMILWNGRADCQCRAERAFREPASPEFNFRRWERRRQESPASRAVADGSATLDPRRSMR